MEDVRNVIIIKYRLPMDVSKVQINLGIEKTKYYIERGFRPKQAGKIAAITIFPGSEIDGRGSNMSIERILELCDSAN